MAKNAEKIAAGLSDTHWRLGENYILKNEFIFGDWEPNTQNLILSVSVTEYIDLLSI